MQNTWDDWDESADMGQNWDGHQDPTPGEGRAREGPARRRGEGPNPYNHGRRGVSSSSRRGSSTNGKNEGPAKDGCPKNNGSDYSNGKKESVRVSGLKVSGEAILIKNTTVSQGSTDGQVKVRATKDQPGGAGQEEAKNRRHPT